MNRSAREVKEKKSGPIIVLDEVVKIYKTAAGGVKALNGINLEIFPGEFVGIIGKSGAGKSTLLNMISGVDELSSGEVRIRNVSVHDLSENQRSLWRGRTVGVVYQTFQLLPKLNLIENILLPMDFCGLFRPIKSRERAMDLLRQMELEEHARKLPSLISGGQQQRVAIARALANDPPILIADEPTGSLDTNTAETVFRIFEELIQKGKTIVMVTHDHGLADRFSRVVKISDGEIAP